MSGLRMRWNALVYRMLSICTTGIINKNAPQTVTHIFANLRQLKP